MIIILTGQPNSGKTTLALILETFLTKRNRTAVTIDGDKLRDITIIKIIVLVDEKVMCH